MAGGFVSFFTHNQIKSQWFRLESASYEAHFEDAQPGFGHRAHPCPLFRDWPQDFQSPEDIVGRLSQPAIDSVFNQLRKSGPLGTVFQMTDAKVLFDNIAHFGDSLVTLNFKFSQFGRG